MWRSIFSILIVILISRESFRSCSKHIPKTMMRLHLFVPQLLNVITLSKNKCVPFQACFVLSSVACSTFTCTEEIWSKSYLWTEPVKKSSMSTTSTRTPLELPAPCCVALCTQAEPRWILIHMNTQRWVDVSSSSSGPVSSTGLFYCPVVKCHLESHVAAGIQYLHPFTRFWNLVVNIKFLAKASKHKHTGM